MMKKTILLLGIIVTFSTINAQKWALPSSTWITSYSHFSFPAYNTVGIEKDTVVQGVLCKKLNSSPPILTYEENDTVYFFQNGLFRPTYYFNVEVGDTISLYDRKKCFSDGLSNEVIDSLFYATVDSIDSIDVGNKFLKRYHCTIFNQSPFLIFEEYYYNYTEFIGSNYIYPDIHCSVDQESIGICDYGDSTIQDFYVFQNDCISVSINELENQKKFISLYPSPANDFINVRLDDDVPSENLKLQIRDLNGKILQESSLKMGVNQLIISHLPSGVYFATYGLSVVKFIKE